MVWLFVYLCTLPSRSAHSIVLWSVAGDKSYLGISGGTDLL